MASHQLRASENFLRTDDSALAWEISSVKLRVDRYVRSVMYRLSSKNMEKTPTPTRDVILEKKFETPPSDARELKLRPFDLESKTTSDYTNSFSFFPISISLSKPSQCRDWKI